MLIVETSVFTRQVREIMDDESYRLLQVELAQHPEAGAVIRGTGGLRKIRWAAQGRGKRGGARVIYYWVREQSIVLMLLAYPKNVQDDLTTAQRRALKALVEEEFK